MDKLISIVFVRKSNKFELKFDSGLILIFGAPKIEFLKGQDHSHMENVTILDKGTVLFWSELDIKVPVETLITTLLEGKTWSH